MISLSFAYKETDANTSHFSKYMIDDNYIKHSEKEGHTIYNNGKYVKFLQKSIKIGKYKFQCVFVNKELGTPVYSNIIEIIIR